MGNNWAILAIRFLQLNNSKLIHYFKSNQSRMQILKFRIQMLWEMFLFIRLKSYVILGERKIIHVSLNKNNNMRIDCLIL